MNNLRISKSQYLRGIQCPKSLWYYRYKKELIPEEEPDNINNFFNAGHEVGKLAQGYFKNGIEIVAEPYEIEKSIKLTNDAIANRNSVVFEATASSDDGAYSKIDIFKKVNDSDEWDLIEVKMSTGVKDYYIDDLALQRYAFLGAGYKIRKSILMHVNNQYVRSGDLNLKKFFTLNDCTDEVVNKLGEVKNNLSRLFKILKHDTEPDIGPGDHCCDPFECEFCYHCWPERSEHSVYNIFGKGTKRYNLINAGIQDIRDIPDDFSLTDREFIAVTATKKKKIIFDKKKIDAFLNDLEYPLYYLDYETIFPVVPLFDQNKPYQQIPFQFSLHIQKEKNEDSEHIEFLHIETGDPRPEFIKALIKACGETGSVVVYNIGFERTRNRELGENFPEYKEALDKISNRMVDLLIPFRSRFLYHPKMKGSASIKKVLPAFVPELNYDDLEIGDGGTASHLYLCCKKNIVSENEKSDIFLNLKKYCYQDTYAEVLLIDTLYKYS